MRQNQRMRDIKLLAVFGSVSLILVFLLSPAIALAPLLRRGQISAALSLCCGSWAALAALAFMVLLVLTQERAMTLTHVKFTKCQHLLWCNVPLGDGFASTGFPKLRRFHNPSGCEVRISEQKHLIPTLKSPKRA